ncbi:YhcB family protein [Bordetella sp. LUAb4]|uniref:YhcB family protein n=1 Tax=Bordetella sp. LUAb4 TaxID=2843195 RepID=UPI001E3A0364|nr:YhcB family protein [Bordetella sp. LUAb4]
MPRSVVFRILLVLIVGLVIGAEAMYLVQQKRQADSDAPTPQAVQALNAELAQRSADLEFVRRQLDMAEGELAVERSTRNTLSAQVSSQMDQLGTLRDRLAFYEQLLPPGPGGVVSVRGLDVEHTAEGLSYRVLLMRSARSGSPPFVGSLQFVAEGTQNGKPKTAVLSLLRPASPTPKTAADTIPFDFDQYQRGQGLLAVPEGFVPASITLNVLEGGVVRATRTVKGPF